MVSMPHNDEHHLPAARVERLVKSYGRTRAVDGISFSVHAGEVLGLLGPNGAGKTSLLSVLATLRKPTQGEAYVFEREVRDARRWVQRMIGFVPQDLAIYNPLTAAENIRFFGRMYSVPSPVLEDRIEKLLALVGLEQRHDDRVATFSGGMKRRLNIAVGLVHDPRLILMDEPTVGVDPQSREHIFEIVRNLRDQGAAILYATHYMEEAERLCDRLIIMDGGRVIAHDTLPNLLARAEQEELIEIRGLPDEVDLSFLARVHGVHRLAHAHGCWSIATSETVRLLEPLSQALLPHADAVTMEIAPTKLDALFLALTGKTLRD